MPHINILSEEEIKTLYGLPNFDDDDRLAIFKLAENESAYLETLNDVGSKVDFILQAGYFKATVQFFKFTLQERMEDTRFVMRQYYPDAKFPKQTIKRHVHYKNKKEIRGLYDFKTFTTDFQLKMLELAKSLLKTDASPRFIFNELLGFCNESRTIIPAYRTFQFILSNVLQQEENRLFAILKNKLSKALRNELDAILKNDESFSHLSFLKKKPKEFSTKEMRDVIQKHQQILPFYKKSAEILPALGISPGNIAYYGGFVELYSPYRLKQLMGKNKVHLYLLCYIHQRLRVVTDHLVTFLNFRVSKYSNEASIEAQKLWVFCKSVGIENQT